MANQLVTDYFRLHNVNQFKESISETANSVYYVFAGRSTPYANGDVVTPPSQTVYDIQLDVHDNMLFGKRVSADDVATMIPRINWTANTVYTAYRDYLDLTDKPYYACVNSISQFHVFKVLDNAGGIPSTVSPQYSDTADDDDFYQTSDGYVWKYMYTIPKSKFDKFATEYFIPVIPNANVVANAVMGAIDVIEVTYPGSHYNSYLSNTFISPNLRVGGSRVVYGISNTASTLSGYYEGCYLYISSGTGAGQSKRITKYEISGTSKLITIDSAFNVPPDVTSGYDISPAVNIRGDGISAVGRAIVNASSSNSIARVDMIQRGSEYSWGDANVVGSTDGFSNTATLRVIIGPKGGHGSNPEVELKGGNLGISVTFANTEGTTIPATNDYRTIGIIKDPTFANVTLGYSTVTTFTVGESLYQQSTRAEGVVVDTDNATFIRLKDVRGIFTSSANIVGYASNSTANVDTIVINGVSKGFDTFDHRTRLGYVTKSGTDFIEDEMLYQLDPVLANSYYHSIDANNMAIYIVNPKGSVNTGINIIGSNSGAIANVGYVYPPDITHSSGEVIYIENMDPLARSVDQSEVIKIVLKF